MMDTLDTLDSVAVSEIPLNSLQFPSRAFCTECNNNIKKNKNN